MATPNFSYRTLYAFQMLVQEKSFTRAAHICHVSQSTFSLLIQQLEEDLGVPLCIRSTRNVQLTIEGEHFARASSDILEKMRLLETDLAQFKKGYRGVVRIATLPSVAGSWLAPILTQYQKMYPDIRIEIHDVLSQACIEYLWARKVDMAIAAPIEHIPDCHHLPLFTEDFLFVCSIHHPLAQQEQIILEDVKQEPLIALSLLTSIQQNSHAFLEAAGIRTVAFEVHNLATAAALIDHQMGVCFMPRLAFDTIQRPSLRAIPIANNTLYRTFSLFWHKETILSLPCQQLIAMMDPSNNSAPKGEDTDNKNHSHHQAHRIT